MKKPAQKYTVLELIRLMSQFLADKGIENPRLNAELLAGKVLNLDRVQLYLNFERPVSPDELSELREMLRRRANHEPLQYLLGETEFYSLNFKTSPKTLIPRPETEILVDFIVKNYQTFFPEIEKIHILDIGTGSGNIAIALAKNIPAAKVLAVDVNAETLKIAQENAEKNEVAAQIEFLEHDIFSSLPEKFSQCHIVAANLPYISEAEMETLPREVVQFEPRIALYGGVDGTDYFRKLNEVLDKILLPGGVVVLEIGASQKDRVREIFSKNERTMRSEIIEDYNQLPRVFWAQFR